MKGIVKVRTFYVFFALSVPLILANFFKNSFTGNILYAVYYILHFLYLVSTYLICLDKVKPKKQYLFWVASIVAILFQGFLGIFVPVEERIEFTGYVGAIMSLAFLGSVFFTLYFISDLQISYTTKSDTSAVFSYFLHAISFFFLPVGIWYLLPRLKNGYELWEMEP